MTSETNEAAYEIANDGHCPSPIIQVALCGQPIPKKAVIPPPEVLCPTCLELQEEWGFQWHAGPITW